MNVTSLGATTSVVLSGASPAPKTQPFSKALEAARGENAPQAVQTPQAPRLDAVAPPAVDPTKVLERVNQAQTRMEQILTLAESGKSFSPAELLSLQTHVYRASQELDLAGKVVEKATGGVKQVLQTQV